MRKALSLILLVSILPMTNYAQNDQKRNEVFTLRSADMGGQATLRNVFNGFGCTGENMSPQLSWANPPEGTKSFAITMHDPDAPTGSGWWHWVVYNIPADVSEIPAGAGNGEMPEGAVQGRTDFGATGYGGPCPPEGHGPHQYIITVHALDTEKLGVPEDASPALIGFNLNDRSIARASIVFYYER